MRQSLIDSGSAVDESASLELKCNVTDTELVLIEDLSSPDSNAVILRSTAVLHYQPNKERVLLCNLQVSVYSQCAAAHC